MNTNSPRLVWGVSAALILLAAVSLQVWVTRQPDQSLALRVPGTDQPPGVEAGGAAGGNPVLRGTLVPGTGKPANLAGFWPQFRGPLRDGLSYETGVLLREWSGGKPKQLWSIELGEGYAGPVVVDGRVYLMDYDRAKQQDALRCLSLADGQEIWHFGYPIQVKRNHGMSRTVPTVSSNRVVALGPKCHVVCVDATTGELRWGLDLVRAHGTTVPPWYAGQCPLLDEGRVILAPGGPDALLMAVEAESGKPLWTTPNPRGWKMTHSSILAAEIAGRRMFVYCASGGAVGVDARDGTLLWETADWKISIATVASPVPVGNNRLFFSGGYNAGSLMLELQAEGDSFLPKTLFRLKPEVFGATQQTPILQNAHLYGVRPDGDLVCLDLEGNVRWSSGPEARFGLGAFLMAGDLIYAVDDVGRLSLFEATPAAGRLLAQAEVIADGREAWGPLALAGGRLFVRDLTRMVCLEVGSP